MMAKVSFSGFTEKDHLSIRDPLHGSIRIEDQEKRILEHPALQRLRMIKQLGFAEIPYPGATHHRFLHSVGAMEVATKIWREVQESIELPSREAAEVRSLIRACVLLHDIGHAPLSHTLEAIMPAVSKLQLPSWLVAPEETRQADHEDYTLKLVLASSLTGELEKAAISPQAVAQVISGRRIPGDSSFLFAGYDLFPMLRQIVSSEIDADRMDYLLRDAFFCGVSYGEFDLDWLIRHLRPFQQGSRVALGLKKRALYTFEDFLLSRYHMFFSVYYHHLSVCYQEMLLRYLREEPGEYTLPDDAEAYQKTDDSELWSILRQSKNPWAKRIVERRPYRKLLEVVLPSDEASGQGEGARKPHASGPSEGARKPHAFGPSEGALQTQASGWDEGALQTQASLYRLEAGLTQAAIPFFTAASRWLLSRYAHAGQTHPQEDGLSLHVLDDTLLQILPLQEASLLYRRYAESHRVIRLFVEPEAFDRAKRILQTCLL